MKKSILKYQLFLIILALGYSNACLAISARGYIISNEGDTIHGLVQLSRFDKVTGGLLLNGFDEESLHISVTFLSEGQRKSRIYYPEMTKGFEFTYHSENYIYKSVVIQRKSLFKSERQQCRFVRILYDENGEHRYKDVLMIPNPGFDGNKDKYLKYNSHEFRVKKNQESTKEKVDSLKTIQKNFY